MQLTLPLPDAFEAIALEPYREHKLTTAQLRRLPGFPPARNSTALTHTA